MAGSRMTHSGHPRLLSLTLSRHCAGPAIYDACGFSGQFNAHRNIAAAGLARMVLIETLSVRGCFMSVLTVILPGLKVLFERVGKPEIINRPDFFRLGGTGAVIACNRVGWADSLWMAYAVYPRQLRYMSKQELFSPPLSRWVLEHGGSIPI